MAGGNSLAVKWLGLSASTAGALSSIPGQGTKIWQAKWPKMKQQQKMVGYMDTCKVVNMGYLGDGVV